MPKSADARRRGPRRGPLDRAGGRRLAAALAWLIGPALVAGVAYLDPGNVASNMTAGAQYGYLLVWVVVLGNTMAWLIQYLSAKLGVVTGKSLPEVLGERIGNRWGRRAYWLQAELVAMATDLAEVIGGAVALNLLFGVPLVWGGLITGAVSLVLLVIQSRRGARPFEFVIIGLLVDHHDRLQRRRLRRPARPGRRASAASCRGSRTPNSVLLAASILGATIMPHAIYAHSALSRDRFSPQARPFGRAPAGCRSRRPSRPDAASRPPACSSRPAGTSRSRWPSRAP